MPASPPASDQPRRCPARQTPTAGGSRPSVWSAWDRQTSDRPTSGLSTWHLPISGPRSRCLTESRHRCRQRRRPTRLPAAPLDGSPTRTLQASCLNHASALLAATRGLECLTLSWWVEFQPQRPPCRKVLNQGQPLPLVAQFTRSGHRPGGESREPGSRSQVGRRSTDELFPSRSRAATGAGAPACRWRRPAATVASTAATPVAARHQRGHAAETQFATGRPEHQQAAHPSSSGGGVPERRSADAEHPQQHGDGDTGADYGQRGDVVGGSLFGVVVVDLH